MSLTVAAFVIAGFVMLPLLIWLIDRIDDGEPVPWDDGPLAEWLPYDDPRGDDR